MSSSLPSLPVTFRRSVRGILAPLAICLLFAVGGVFMLAESPVWGAITTLFFGVGVLVFAVSLHPRATALTIREDGFEFTNLFRKHFVAWKDVSEFGIVNIAMNRMVGWNYAPTFAGFAKSRKTSKKLAGYEAALPDNYGMSASALLGILSSIHRDRLGAAA